MEIQAEGDRNSLVSDEAKERIYSWLEQYGVDVDHVLLHHYQDGDFVAVRSWDRASGSEAFNNAYHDAVEDYWRNSGVNDDCFWIHREWVEGL